MIYRPDPKENTVSCNEEWLVLLTKDQLDEERTCYLIEHLDHCKSCSEQLNRLSFADTNWSESRTVILEEASKRTQTKSSKLVADEPFPTKITSLIRWLEPIADASPISSHHYIGQVDGYWVKRVIGYGGMGVVLEAWDTKLHRVVAIKAMHPHLAANGSAKQRFVREARGAASVVHPNVVAIHTVHAEHDPPYFIMPLVEGESLQSRIDRLGPLDVDAALRVAIQIADGLSAAHAQGLVHRDIKPANILLEHGTERALLTDFGVVRALNETTMTASGVIAGTPEYMSPEQATGNEIDSRSDLFSLGCVLYAMLSGRSPFRSETTWGVLRRIEKDTPRRLSELRPDLSDAVESLVSWLLEKQPNQRVDSATDLADDLRQLLAHHVDRRQHHLPLRLAKRLQRRSKNVRRIVPWLVACCSIFCASMIVWSLAPKHPKVPALDESTLHANKRSTPSVVTNRTPVFQAELLDAEIRKLDLLTSEIESQLMQSPIAPK